jgi:ABC-type lipoprotein release transport system permease subunit
MNNLILAWRNLWRNRRRTLITSASIFFAVFFALVVDNTFPFDVELEKQILADENVEATIPRFESFALASNGPQTKGVLVMGIDPEKEVHLSKVRDKMVKYRLTAETIEKINQDHNIPEKVKELAHLFENSAYTTASRLQLDLGINDQEASQWMPAVEQHAKFENGTIRMGEPGVWVGDKLSQYLELGIGDTIVLISQGYHATTAAGKYEIKGIVKLPLPDLDNKIVYLPLDICQRLFNAEGNLTSLALAVNDNLDKGIAATVDRITRVVSGDQKVMEWREMNEVMVSQMDADNKGGQIMLGILYLVIAFGIFGTVLMLTAERKREFGVLVAIGMQKKKLASIMTLEMLLIGLLGLLGGAVIASVLILWGVDHPIIFKGETAKIFEEYGMEPKMAFWTIDSYYISQLVIVLSMVLLSILYPLRKIFGMKVVNALRA